MSYNIQSTYGYQLLRKSKSKNYFQFKTQLHRLLIILLLGETYTNLILKIKVITSSHVIILGNLFERGLESERLINPNAIGYGETWATGGIGQQKIEQTVGVGIEISKDLVSGGAARPGRHQGQHHLNRERRHYEVLRVKDEVLGQRQRQRQVLVTPN